VPALPFAVEDLLKPDAYPHRPREIEVAQTQMSLLILTGDYAYKVKKPVDLGYLDYTTLEKRRFFCHQELELNRRLCPSAYLAVVPITMSSRPASQRGSLLHFEGHGTPMEYAVKMKQLPRDRMMDMLLPQGRVSRDMVAGVAERLMRFHRGAATGPEIAAFGSPDAIRHNCDENFTQTAKYIETSITESQYQQIRNYTDSFIDSHTGLFDRRVKGDRIRDCHGDLHAAHVCFTHDICIYDCIEFNDRFRYCDVASEIAFLAMDLDRYQQADLSRALVDTYMELSHDQELLDLLHFYKCYRAYVRGKVESFKLDDPLIPQTEKARALDNARSYFQLAKSYA
jgi:uncharacterized protein